MKAIESLKKIPKQSLKKENIELFSQKLGIHQNWNYHIQNDTQYISRKYKLVNFKMALMFMNQVGWVAQEMQHHPEWSNVYNTVEVNLTTHDTNGITQNDLCLAYFSDHIYNKLTGLEKSVRLEKQKEFYNSLKQDEDKLISELNKLLL